MTVNIPNLLYSVHLLSFVLFGVRRFCHEVLLLPGLYGSFDLD